MNEYNVECFYKNGDQIDVENMDIETCFSPFQIAGVKRLERHIKSKKKYDKVVITFIKRKGA
ncbi:hypothetical protein KHQ81_12975 [Mycoplasmatota bacterium]|nr:hypothetical protein KHQ81_12975 [Mycoplasmatota bacterium]